MIDNLTKFIMILMGICLIGLLLFPHIQLLRELFGYIFLGGIISIMIFSSF